MTIVRIPLPSLPFPYFPCFFPVFSLSYPSHSPTSLVPKQNFNLYKGMERTLSVSNKTVVAFIGHEAGERSLIGALERMRAAGLEVNGTVGDHDPLAAIDAVWDPTRFDEVVISTLPTGVSKWLQVDLPHRAERATGVQVTHVVAQPPRAAPRTEPVQRPESTSGILSPLTAMTGKRPGS